MCFVIFRGNSRDFGVVCLIWGCGWIVVSKVVAIL
jgi:hypothetical protein